MQELDITLVVHGVADIETHDPCLPERAGILGLARVIAQEYPLVRCRAIDVPPVTQPTAAAALAAGVVEEIAGGSEDLLVAYRSGYRWVQVMQPLRLPRTLPMPGRLREAGVYLITGGLGGVGLTLAEHLARTCRARLILVGRTGLPPRAEWEQILSTAQPEDKIARTLKRIQAMEAQGAVVRVFRSDVTDEETMRAVVSSVQAEFGGLNGVIHAAGLLSGPSIRPLARLSAEACADQFSPKVSGVQVLDRVLQGSSPDFCLLTSSLSVVLGGLGFGAYAAANAYLDAFALMRHRQGQSQWISVAWDGWKPEGPVRQSVGMAKGLQELTLDAAEGAEAFDRILSLSGLPRIAVSTANLGGRMEQWVRKPSGVPAEVSQSEERRATHPRPNLFTPYAAASNEVETKVVGIWEELLGIHRVGVNDNFFELGGNSLLGTELIARMKRQFPAPLSLASLFEGPTVRALSGLVSGTDTSTPELDTGRGNMRNEMLARKRASLQKRRGS